MPEVYTSLLNSNNWRVYLPNIGKKIGIYASIMLSELCYKHDYWKEQGKLLDDEWFFLTVGDCEDETGLTKDNQETAINKLIELKIIEKAQKRMPATRHFKINESQLASFLLSCWPQKANHDMSKVAGTNKSYTNKSLLYNTVYNESAKPIPYLENNESDISDSIDISNSAEEPRGKLIGYGRYKNVYLSLNEFESIKKSRLDYKDILNDVSSHIKSTGKNIDNFFVYINDIWIPRIRPKKENKYYSKNERQKYLQQNVVSGSRDSNKSDLKY